MPSPEHEFGPLWNRPNKTTGLRVAIPDPEGIISDLQRMLNESAEDTSDNVVMRNLDQMMLYAEGMSARFMPTERVWILPIDDLVFEDIKVAFQVGYSPKSGEWADIQVYLNVSDAFKESEDPWVLAKRAPEILRHLEQLGFDAQVIINPDQLSRSVVVQGPHAKIEICLGYPSEQIALEAVGDFFPDDPIEESNPLIIMIHSFTLKDPDSQQILQFWQQVIPFTLDAIYSALDYTPPDRVIKISRDSELR